MRDFDDACALSVTAPPSVRCIVDTASRTQLREINESNFARFDAKLEQRAAEILAKVDTKFAELRVEIHRANAATKEGVRRWMIGLWLTQMLAFAGLWFSRA